MAVNEHEVVDNMLAMQGIVGEVFTPSDGTGRVAQRLRIKRRDAFLREAEKLFVAYPLEREEGVEVVDAAAIGRDRITQSIEVAVSSQATKVQVQVVESSERRSEGTWDFNKKLVGIQVTQPAIGVRHLMFCVEQNFNTFRPTAGVNQDYRSSFIRNQRAGSIASNVQVLRGLQAINYIADRLAVFQPSRS